MKVTKVSADHLLAVQVPAGSLPRTMDVILRNDIVEAVRAGDKVEFTGSLIVVPDISVATAPGERITTKFGELRHPCLHALATCSSSS